MTKKQFPIPEEIRAILVGEKQLRKNDIPKVQDFIAEKMVEAGMIKDKSEIWEEVIDSSPFNEAESVTITGSRNGELDGKFTIKKNTIKKRGAKSQEGGGRPTIVTPEVVAKLDYAFMKGLTDHQASDYAGISKDCLYDHCKRNPGYSHRKEMLKGNLPIRSKILLAESIENGNVNDAKWFLERKLKDEFSTRTDITGKDGDPLIPPVIKVEFIDVKKL